MSDENENTPDLVDGFTGDQLAASDKRDAADAVAEADAVEAARDEQYIEALLEERRGYVIFGREDRVAAVDEQLAIRGYKAAAEARAAAAPKSTRGRGTKPQQTT